MLGEVSDDNQMIVDLENHESKVLNERNDGPTLIDVQRVIIDPKRIKRLVRVFSYVSRIGLKAYRRKSRVVQE